jgi:hypothetical protein
MSPWLSAQRQVSNFSAAPDMSRLQPICQQPLMSAAADVISLLGQVDYVNAYLRLCANDVMP